MKPDLVFGLGMTLLFCGVGIGIGLGCPDRAASVITAGILAFLGAVTVAYAFGRAVAK